MTSKRFFFQISFAKSNYSIIDFRNNKRSFFHPPVKTQFHLSLGDKKDSILQLDSILFIFQVVERLPCKVPTGKQCCAQCPSLLALTRSGGSRWVNGWSFLRTLSLCAAGSVTGDLLLSHRANNLVWRSSVFRKGYKVKSGAHRDAKELKSSRHFEQIPASGTSASRVRASASAFVPTPASSLLRLVPFCSLLTGVFVWSAESCVAEGLDAT